MKILKNDRRSKLTKRMLKDALLELLKNQPISKVTVKQLCEKADINRATFYNHFYDTRNVLEYIEEEYCENLKIEVINMLGTNNIPEFILNILTEMKSDKHLNQIITCENTKPRFLRKIINMAHDLIISHWLKIFKVKTKEKLEYAYSFMTTGSFSVINKWLNNNLKESPQEIAEILQRITAGIKHYLTI